MSKEIKDKNSEKEAIDRIQNQMIENSELSIMPPFMSRKEIKEKIEDWEKEFDKRFGKPKKGFEIQTIDGREFCMMCGAPTRVDRVFVELKLFIRTLLKAQREQILGEIDFKCSWHGKQKPILVCPKCWKMIKK